MKVRQFTLDVNYVNAFLAFEERSKNAFLVDCGAFDEKIKQFILDHKLKLDFLLLTHSHYDHVDGIKDFKKAFPVPIYSATDDYDRKVSDGNMIPFANAQIAVYATPGHTVDGVSFYIHGAVFVGDAIFAGAVGGTTSRQAFEEETQHVRNKIFALPDDTIIYPGHGAPSLVGVERIYNPFFVQDR